MIEISLEISLLHLKHFGNAEISFLLVTPKNDFLPENELSSSYREGLILDKDFIFKKRKFFSKKNFK